jgi:hypothetical protein
VNVRHNDRMTRSVVQIYLCEGPMQLRIEQASHLRRLSEYHCQLVGEVHDQGHTRSADNAHDPNARSCSQQHPMSRKMASGRSRPSLRTFSYAGNRDIFNLNQRVWASSKAIEAMRHDRGLILRTG